jgi:holo-[acyl-carrier protein] synthase
MILGTGADIIAIDRIARAIDVYGNRFIKKVFTPVEIDYCSAKAQHMLHFAGRWAAKEAFYKALPLSCQQYAQWQSFEVVSGSAGYGKPGIALCSVRLKQALADAGADTIHLTISHEKTQCIAFVVITDDSV